jgi:hypothetical protein
MYIQVCTRTNYYELRKDGEGEVDGLGLGLRLITRRPDGIIEELLGDWRLGLVQL